MIRIDGDNELTNYAASNNWSGSGSRLDPYLIEDYEVTGGEWGLGLYISATRYHITILNCKVTGAHIEDYLPDISGTGVFLSDVQNIKIERCNISNNEKYGIRMDYCSNIRISGSTISHVPNGVYTRNCTSIYVNNSLVFEASNGVYFHNNYLCQIKDNVVRDCSSNGIVFMGSDTNQVVGNLLLRNDRYGMDIVSGSNNEIFNNSFCYNLGTCDDFDEGRVQASDQGSANRWYVEDDIGNHWRDRSGPDVDKNGIVDGPYYIDGGNARDDRPLTRSRVPTVPMPPRFITIGQNTTGLNLSWEAPYDQGVLPVTMYSIFRTDGYTPPCRIGWTIPMVKYFLDEDVVEGGRYIYHIIAANPVGFSNPSASVNVVRDHIPPEFISLTPLNGSFLDENVVRVSWDASDNLGKIDHYEIRIDNGSWFDVGDRKFQVFGPLEDGTHCIMVKAYDRQENQNLVSTTFIVDTEPPGIKVLSPKLGDILKTNNVTVEFEVTETTSGLREAYYSIDGPDRVDIIDPDRIFLRNLSEGAHTLVIQAVDNSLNTGRIEVDFHIDTISPVITILEPREGATLRNRDVFLRWNATDLSTSIASLLCKLDNEIWTDLMNKDTFLYAQVEDGDHSITIFAEDLAGHRSNTTVRFKIDLTPPRIIDYGPKGSDAPVNCSIWLCFDEVIDPSSFQLRIDGKLIENIREENGTYRYFFPVILRSGTSFSVSVYATDLYGNELSGFEWKFSVSDPTLMLKGWVYGSLIDQDGLPIVNATVTSEGLNSTLSDMNGAFIYELGPGFHRIEFKKKGYATVRMTVLVQGGGGTDLGSIVLENRESHSMYDHIEIIAAFIGAILVLILSITLYAVHRRRRMRAARSKSAVSEGDASYPKRPPQKRLIVTIPSGPTEMEQNAMLSLVSKDDLTHIDGEIGGDDLGRFPIPDLELEETSGLDLSFIGDDLEEMDWEDLGHPLYEMDLEEEMSMMDIDCYKKLGISRDASREEIKNAYRKLAVRYHPDKISRFDKLLRDRAIEEMKRINYAREVLLDNDRRALYDATLPPVKPIEFGD